MATNGLTIPIFANLENFQKSMDALAEKASKVGENLSKKLSAPIIGAGGVATKLAIDFETAMAKVSTLSDETVKPLDQMAEEIKKLSNETGISAEEIANNVYDALSAGQTTETAVDFVATSTKLAVAGFADAGETLDLLTTILNSYGMEAEEAARVSDILVATQDKGKISVAEMSASMGKIIPTANSMGINLEQIASGYSIMTAKGIAAAETTTYMNTMFNEMGKSGSIASKNIKAAFKGKSFQQLIKEGKSVGDVLAGMEKYAKKNKLSLSDMFGSAEAGKAAIVLANEGGKEFNDMLKEMGEVSGSTQKNFDKMSETTAVKFQVAMNKGKNALISFGDIILPYISKGFDYLSKFMDKLTNIPEGPRKIIVGIALALAAIGPALMGVSKVVSVVGKLGVVFSPVGLAIMGVVAVVGLLKIAIDKNIGGAGDKFKVFVEKIKGLYEQAKVFFDKIKNLFTESMSIGKEKGATEGITNFISKLTGADAGKVKEVLGLIKASFENMSTAIKSIIENILLPIINYIIEIVKQLPDIFSYLLPLIAPIFAGIGILFNILMKAIEAIAPAFKLVIETIGNVVMWLIGVIQWAMPFISAVFQGLAIGIDIVLAAIYLFMPIVRTVVDGVIAAVIFFWDSIKLFFSTGFAVIKGLFAAFSAAFKGDWTAMGQALVGIVNTLKESVKTAFQNIVKAIKNTFKNLPDDMKQFGKDAITGLINGVKGMLSTVGEVATSIGNTLKNGFKTIMGINSPSRVFKQYGLWTGEGLAIGINRSGGMVEKSTDNLGGIVSRAGANIFSSFDDIQTRLADMSDMKINTTVSASKVQRYSEFHIGAKKEEAVIENHITLDGRVLTSELSPRFDIASGSRIKINSRRTGVK